MVGYSFLVCLKATRPGEILHVRQCHVGCLTQDGNLTSPDADKLKILRCCVCEQDGIVRIGFINYYFVINQFR